MRHLFQSLTLCLTFFFGFFILGLLFTPEDAQASHVNCNNWGVTAGGDPNYPGGLVVRTIVGGADTSGISWILNSASGSGIKENNSSFVTIASYGSRAFTTGDSFYCASWTESHPGYTVLGMGSTGSGGTGNRFTMWCSGGPFEITSASTPPGRNGYWAGNPGVFNAINGDTVRITLTWVDVALPTPTPVPATPTPTPTPVPGSLQGAIINDWNGNGIQDPGEPRLGVSPNPPSTISVSYSGGIPTSTILQGQSFAAGHISFSNSSVPPGNYNLTLNYPLADWKLTTANSPQTVAVPAGGNVSAANFGLQPCPVTPSNVYPAAGDQITEAKPTFKWSYSGPTVQYQEVQLRRGSGNFALGYWRARTSGSYVPVKVTLAWPNWGTLGPVLDPDSNLTNQDTSDLTSNGLISEDTYWWRVVNHNPCGDRTSTPTDFIYYGPPWFTTATGDIGSLGNITVAEPADTLTLGQALVTAGGSISLSASKASTKSWSLANYNLSQPPRSTHGYFWNLLSSKVDPTALADGELNSSRVNNCTTYCMFKYGGSRFTWNSTGAVTYAKPVVVFIGTPDDGVTTNLRFDENFVPSGSGIVFVVEGDVEVKSTVGSNSFDVIRGVFIIDGTFDSKYDSTAPFPCVDSGANPADCRLGIQGSVIAHDGLTLRRNRGVENATQGPIVNPHASEWFIYQPKYLVDFRELIGAPSYSWTEVAP